jgi:hypothetical protein
MIELGHVVLGLLQQRSIALGLQQFQNGAGIFEAGLPASQLCQMGLVVAQLLERILGIGLIVPKFRLGRYLL